jgi:hypothetical protein
VLDKELVAAAFKVLIGGERAEALDKGVVGCGRVGMRGGACIVECGKDARRSLLLDQIAHHLLYLRHLP